MYIFVRAHTLYNAFALIGDAIFRIAHNIPTGNYNYKVNNRNSRTKV